MGTRFGLGRIFYGLAIAETGLQTIYYHDFPYWLVPPKHSWIPGIAVLASGLGVMLLLAGIGIIFQKLTRPAALLLGGVLLAVFLFGYVPYQLIAGPNKLPLLEWENAEKELAIASGAFVIAGFFPAVSDRAVVRWLGKLVPAGPIIFALMMISFGLVHVLYAVQVADYVPSWVPSRIFWAYLAGAGLMASGVGIILNIKRGLAATLLGAMILIWFIILHIPRVIASPVPYLGSEVTSAFIALAYSGIAFALAGQNEKAEPRNSASS